MNHAPVAAIAALTLGLTAWHALAQQPAGHAGHSGIDHSRGAQGPPAKKQAAAEAYAAAYRAAGDKMHAAMAIEPSGDADVDFVKGMIPHHQGAVEMARIVLQFGKDPQLKKLARDIIAAQDKEIAFMQQWLARNGRK
jgi:uncharacterized protein (DUF305 family)